MFFMSHEFGIMAEFGLGAAKTFFVYNLCV